MPIARLVVFVLLASLFAAACSRPRPQAPVRHPNLVVVLVDTLRADHLGLYGYSRDTSPELDRFAQDAFVFEQATSQASCTFPSANSILTSRSPRHFVGQPDGAMGIPDTIHSLAEILERQGYATAAVSASPIVRATPSRHNPQGGFGRGFSVFSETCLWNHAGCVTGTARQQLDSLAEPFFLYLHYMDPHDPYNPPEEHVRRFPRPYSGPEFVAAGDPNPIAEMLFGDGPKLELGPEDRQHLIDLYDESIRYFDGQWARFLGALEERDLAGRTVIALVSDHGEEFLEHGSIKHCRTLFETEIRTPMLLRVPWVKDGRRIEHLAANLDLVPTVLDYLALGDADLGLEGLSLRPAIERNEAVRRHATSWQASRRSVRDERYKLIYELGRKRGAAYDLDTDPLETHALEEAPPGVLDRLFEELWRQDGGATELDAGRSAMDRLRALGYLE